MLYNTENRLKKDLSMFVEGFELTSRLKDPYSILKKLKRKHSTYSTFDDLADFIAFRVIVTHEWECYAILDMLNDFYQVKDPPKDLIKNPKPNGYQSIHVIFWDSFYNHYAEIQIRTREMHIVAEYGRATHLKYKQQQEKELKKFFNLKNCYVEKAIEMQKNFSGSTEELIEYELEIKKIWALINSTDFGENNKAENLYPIEEPDCQII